MINCVGESKMNKKIFWVILVIIITVTNLILFSNFYNSKIEKNNEIINKDASQN